MPGPETNQRTVQRRLDTTKVSDCQHRG